MVKRKSEMEVIAPDISKDKKQLSSKKSAEVKNKTDTKSNKIKTTVLKKKEEVKKSKNKVIASSEGDDDSELEEEMGTEDEDLSEKENQQGESSDEEAESSDEEVDDESGEEPESSEDELDLIEEEEDDTDEDEGSEDEIDEEEEKDKLQAFDFNGMSEAIEDEEGNGVKENGSNIYPHPSPRNNEYDFDSSDEEDVRNTVGNIPLNWYDEYPHIGYDLDGRKLIKPKLGDKLDDFLRRMEDPDFWRTVKDKQTGQNVILSDKDFELIKRLQSGKVPDPEFDNYAPWIEWFSSEVMETPLKAMPPSKTSFLPSKIDKMKISRMVHAIKMGWMKPKPKVSKEQQFYMLWDSDDKADEMRRIHDHIPAPKFRLPGNAESYNPPAEYLLDDQEMKDWQNKDDEPWKRKYNFVPQKYKRLRDVPAYDKYIKERFERCLDLYLCPRAKKMRLTIKAEDLVPQLPNPKDLQPFPTVCSMIYKGHAHMVRSISLEPFGQFFASGSEDGTVKIWEVATGRCIKTFEFGGVVRCVEWCPNKSLSLVAVAVDNDLYIINPGVGDKLVVKKTDTLLSESPEQGEYRPSERVTTAVQWEPLDEEKSNKGIRIVIRHFKIIHQVTWHAKGDYFSTVMQDGQNRSVIIHQLSSRRSQLPLNRSKGLIQCVLFHPVRPIFFIATQRHVRIYNLAKQEIVKKLMTGAKWISSLAIHPGGDNVLVGTYDKKVMWFDLDLSTKPYQTLRFHGNAIRSVAFHKRYPLFASGSDDCSLIISHGMVYNDLLQNPLLVPVKKLRGHDKFSDFGILSVMFHNMQPWVFSSGADKTIRLFT